MYTTIGTYYSFQIIVCCPVWIGFLSSNNLKAHNEEDNKLILIQM